MINTLLTIIHTALSIIGAITVLAIAMFWNERREKKVNRTNHLKSNTHQ